MSDLPAWKAPHDEAMACADAAVRSMQEVKIWYRAAYASEIKAARACIDNAAWRAILFRSAGWLAMKGGIPREALAAALAGLEVGHDRPRLEELKAAAQAEIAKREREG